MAMTPEQKRKRRAELGKAWRQTEKGKACIARQHARIKELRSTPEGRAKFREYNRTYRKSERGKEKNRPHTTRVLRRRYNRNMSRQRAAKLWALAHKAAPTHLPPAMRDDVIMDIVAGVMNGDFLMKDIPANAKKIITANWKHNSKFGPVSLDAPRYEDGAPLIDSISVGMWD